MRMLSEYSRFFREFRRDFHHTGAILPSGVFLARALASGLRGPRTSARILEVGPGSGAVTRVIVKRMQPGDCLDAVEINPRFAQLLEHRLQIDPSLRGNRDQIRVINAAIQEVPGESQYDFIISGLPLNNFTPDEIQSIFETLTRLIRPDGLLSYFEYAFIRTLKSGFVGRQERQRLQIIGKILDGYLHKYQVRRNHILLNVPPAIVRHLRLKPTTGESSSNLVS